MGKIIILGLVLWMAYTWLKGFLIKNDHPDRMFKRPRQSKNGKSQKAGMDIQDAEYEEIE